MSEASPGFTPTGVVLHSLAFTEGDPALLEQRPLPTPPLRYTIEASVDEAERAIVVAAELFLEDDEDGPSIFALRARMSMRFTWTPPLPLEPAVFARTNAPAFLWPHVRELVWSTLVRSGLPPLLLPSVNFSRATVNVVEQQAAGPPPDRS